MFPCALWAHEMQRATLGVQEMIIVSACLVGLRTRYDGGRLAPDEVLLRLARLGQVIPVCPEQLGGLATPREPAEIVGGDGQAVLLREARVLTRDGRDVTEEYIAGAQEVLRLAQLAGVRRAILKERSPSCGSSCIHDGTFSQKLTSGWGVTAALLRREGIEVLGTDEL